MKKKDIIKKYLPKDTEKKLNDKYLHNDYFYLTCNDCDRLISSKEMTEQQYNDNNGYCYICRGKQ